MQIETPSRRTGTKWLVWAFLALPLLELVAFVVVSTQIGVLRALLALIVVSLIGAGILRAQWREAAAGIRIVMDDRRVSAVDLREAGLHRWLAGLLLVVPGFVTGVLGGLLLLAPVRRWLGAKLAALSQKPQRDPSIIDLPQDDWRVVPQERLERSRDKPTS